MNRPAPRTLKVINKTQLSPHMLRITLGGQGLDSFPAEQEGAYIKLMFANDKGTKPTMRTYTVRHQRPQEIDVDFVIHDADGPAASWAKQTQPNDEITVGGPGPKKAVDRGADWFFMVGDMTALPAIASNLAALPSDARGYAVIEVLDQADIPNLQHPDNIDVHWLVNPQPDPSGETLLSFVKSLDWLPGRVSAWAACEFTSMRKLRQFFKQTQALEKDQLYISSYWKIGLNEDQHKIEKQQDAVGVA
ncbi:Vibriobactin utilization protein ViuB [Zhongshania aliphaticivorans]|uniref:Vibriobactin utilization protein ViuB n=1 Tax=Zhongshania aliphaticivorans TaxID=1470434 RepID=A0A5S9MTB7_9GAMM|nr:siderophore-interacting protein [Zhongshania aliphaticivorans]CAA0080453.1 Vibriobactin utilization protein ViuB [Zhongshania aliphaticivorans]CAA0085723.1 Vibriobactin utilization protein ViuB [Zhongshania aliphaticivorans]